jgi:hypothetical protein
MPNRHDPYRRCDMTVYLTKSGDRVFLRAGNAGQGPPFVYDCQEIGPGWKYWGRTYEEWLALPIGPHTVPAGYNPDDDYAPPGR